MTHTALWKGLCGGFSPDPVRIDDLIGNRLRKSGLKGTRTRGKCTFASTNRSQAENYSDGPETLVQVMPEPGAVLTWSREAPDLILNLDSFVKRARWSENHWASARARAIIADIGGDVMTLETYLRMQSRSRALPEIIDRWLNQICISEVDFSTQEKMTDDLAGHAGEVWITGPCRLISTPSVDALGEKGGSHLAA
jgi:hypothetical protein